jgi:hypothetical protein
MVWPTRGLVARNAVVLVMLIALAAWVLPRLSGDVGGSGVGGEWPQGSIAGLSTTVLAGSGWMLAITALFIGLKGWAIMAAARAVGVRLSIREACRAFVGGVAVEAFTWPGKAWADGYRVHRLSAYGAGTALQIIAWWRIGTMFASTSLALVATMVLGQQSMQHASAWQAMWVGGAGLMLLIALWMLRRSMSRIGVVRPSLRILARVVVLSIVASLIDTSAACVSAWMHAGVEPWVLAPRFQVLGMVSAASTMPMGLGVLDASFYAVLTRDLGVAPDQAVMTVTAYRLLGSGTTLMVGVFTLAIGLAKRG